MEKIDPKIASITEEKVDLSFLDLAYEFPMIDKKQARILTYDGSGAEREIEDTLMKRLGSVVKSHKMLKELRIYWPNCEFSATSVRYLAEGIKGLRFLKKVKITFTECLELSNTGMALVTRVLRSLSSLRSLEIENYKIEPAGKISFWMQGFKALKSLAELNLKVPDGLHTDDFNILSRVLRNMKSLEKMRFDFPEWNFLNDKSMENFLMRLIALKNLIKLSLDIRR